MTIPETLTTADQARDFAIEWQHWQSEQPMSYMESSRWQDFFESLAVRFPELSEEFIENAIIK